MAEALVAIGMDEDTPTQPKFYCHSCQREIDAVLSNYTCPCCTKGFIEELPPASEQSQQQRRGSDSDLADLAMSHNNLSDLNASFSEELSSLLLSITGARPTIVDGSEDIPATLQLITRPDGTFHINRSRRVRRRPLHHNLQDIDNAVQDFLISVTSAGGSTPMYFMGNPADYVYGRDGLDRIVTQLLNQIDGAGPPPLNKDTIDEIPKVNVTEEQVLLKIQCSVCWEDFVLKELVRKLSCEHIYHENCIVPWLELHGTCPVCRKSLSNDPAEEQQTIVDVANSLRNVTALYRDHEPSSSTSGTSLRQTRSSSRLQQQQQQSTTQASSSSAQQPQNDRIRDDDGNIDFDFD